MGPIAPCKQSTSGGILDPRLLFICTSFKVGSRSIRDILDVTACKPRPELPALFPSLLSACSWTWVALVAKTDG
jgi:hypothetical protein